MINIIKSDFINKKESSINYTNLYVSPFFFINELRLCF